MVNSQAYIVYFGRKVGQKEALLQLATDWADLLQENVAVKIILTKSPVRAGPSQVRIVTFVVPVRTIN